MKKHIKILLASLFIMTSLVACGSGESSSTGNIKFADAGWDSIKFHNAVAGTVAEAAFGYTWEEVPGSTPVTHEGTLSGEIDVHMEEWTDNIVTYMEDLEAGKLQELGLNFGDNNQGIYVPRYVIEGDAERGIEPMAPDLKTVEDLKKYPDVFPDDDDTSMGRIYGAIPGWEVDQIMYKKYQHYGLDENYNYFRPGSQAALSAALEGAYEKGEGVVGYYWEPTWLIGKYDFVLLEDEPFDETNYLDGESAMPSVRVTIAVSNNFYEDDKNQDMIDFLSNYETSSGMTSEALAYMQDTGADYVEAAEWFIEKESDLFIEWLGQENAEKVFNAIN